MSRSADARSSDIPVFQSTESSAQLPLAAKFAVLTLAVGNGDAEYQ